MLLEERQRRHDVALRLRHLLAIGIEHPARDRSVLPRQRTVLVLGAQQGREEPRPDDVVRLRTNVHREHAREEIRVFDPAAGNLRRERRRRPGVHDVRIAGEPARSIALVGRVPVGHVGRGVDRQAILCRQEPGVVVDGAILAHAIPERERHAEESLAADAPVTDETIDPVLEARVHVGRMPAELAAARDSASRASIVLMNHCRLVTISSGRSPFS